MKAPFAICQLKAVDYHRSFVDVANTGAFKTDGNTGLFEKYVDSSNPHSLILNVLKSSFSECTSCSSK